MQHVEFLVQLGEVGLEVGADLVLEERFRPDDYFFLRVGRFPLLRGVLDDVFVEDFGDCLLLPSVGLLHFFNCVDVGVLGLLLFGGLSPASAVFFAGFGVQLGFVVELGGAGLDCVLFSLGGL